MPNKIANRVKMTVSGTPGTGTITLGSAVAGFQSFAGAGVSNADTVPYIIEDGAAWEIGVGTYTSSGTTMSRSVTASSNSGNAINATSAAIVMISPLAADLQAGTAANNLVALDGSAKLPAVDGSALTNLNAGAATSGTLAVTRGGTGLTSLTAGYIPYGNGTGAFSSSAGLFYNGNLGVNNSSPAYRIDAVGNGIFVKPATTTAITEIASGSSDFSSSFRASVLRQYSSATTGTVFGQASASSGVLLFQNTSVGIVGTNGATPLIFGTLDAERMRITSGGNVGIGTSSPAALLTLRYSSATVDAIRLENTATNGRIWVIGDGAGGTAGNLNVYDATAASLRLILDASGNLGLGVTPSAWNSAFKALQVGNAAISKLTNSGYFSSNAFYGASGYNYIASDYALLYAQENGKHYWSVAPSGTAGNAISFTQAMTLDASGNLGIGTTAPNYKLDVAGLINTTDQFRASGGGGDLRVNGNFNGNLAAIGVVGANPLMFFTNNTERARIDANGNIEVKNSASVPSSNPSGGGVLYVEGGALKYRGSSGTVTTIANA